MLNFVDEYHRVYCSTDETSLAVRQPWFDPSESDPQINENARRGFEAVLLVRQRLYTGERFQNFAANIINFAHETNRTKQSIHEIVSESIFSSFIRSNLDIRIYKTFIFLIEFCYSSESIEHNSCCD